jgi:hypothetical protein
MDGELKVPAGGWVSSSWFFWGDQSALDTTFLLLWLFVVVDSMYYGSLLPGSAAQQLFCHHQSRRTHFSLFWPQFCG